MDYSQLVDGVRRQYEKTVYNVLLDRYDSITIGEVKGKLSATLQSSREQAVEKAVAISSSSASADYATKAEYRALSGAVGGNQSAIINLQNYQKAIDSTTGGYVMILMDANKQSDCLYILIDSPVLSSAQKIYRWDENGLCYSSTGTSGTWTSIIDANGHIYNSRNYSGVLAQQFLGGCAASTTVEIIRGY